MTLMCSTGYNCLYMMAIKTDIRHHKPDTVRLALYMLAIFFKTPSKEDENTIIPNVYVKGPKIYRIMVQLTLIKHLHIHVY